MNPQDLKYPKAKYLKTTNQKIILSILLTVFILACNMPTPTPVVVTATASSATLFPVTFTPIGSTVPFAVPNDGPLNCRSGPGTNYDVLIVLGAAQSAEIAGKSPDGTWWYVKNPLLAGSFCWVTTVFVNTSGDLNSVPVVGVPATPTNAASTVIAVDLTIDPDTVHVAGCNGPSQPVTITAKIQTNGPMQVRAHFRDELQGDLPAHDLTFTRADIQDISDSFTPTVKEGRHRIFLVIEGLDLSDLSSTKPYQITC